MNKIKEEFKTKIKFDVILNMEIIEHVEDVNLFLKACSKFLKKNGIMFVATLNKTLKSYVFAIVGAEYILRWLPIGTHDWQKFLKPNLSEVEQIFFPPAESLLSPEYHLRQKPPTNSTMSMTWAINYNNKNIWGLTARVLVTISAGLGLREFPPCDDI